jgi:hypothetical protein
MCKQQWMTSKVASKQHLNQSSSSLFISQYFSSNSLFIIDKQTKESTTSTSQCRHHKEHSTRSKVQVSARRRSGSRLIHTCLTTYRRLYCHKDRPQRHIPSHRPYQTRPLRQSRFHQRRKQRHRSLHCSQFRQSWCIHDRARRALRP